MSGRVWGSSSGGSATQVPDPGEVIPAGATFNTRYGRFENTNGSAVALDGTDPQTLASILSIPGIQLAQPSVEVEFDEGTFAQLQARTAFAGIFTVKAETVAELNGDYIVDSEGARKIG